MPSQPFSPQAGTSGRIVFSGFFYTATTGVTNVDVGQNDLTGSVTRGFMQFLTGAYFTTQDVDRIDGVNADMVEDTVQSMTPPDEVKIYIGTWIGAALTGIAGDYNGGTTLNLDILPTGTGNVDLSSGFPSVDPTTYISLTAETDIALRAVNNSSKNSSRAYNTAKVSSILNVDWTPNWSGETQVMVVNEM